MKLTIQRSELAAFWLVACMAWMLTNAGASTPGFTTTTVQGTVYLASGQPGSGTLQLSWPAFTTASNSAVTAGRMNVTIGADGFVSVKLAPNLGSTPAGLYYTAVYHLSDGTTSTEYWVVPAAAQASLTQVRAQVMPAAQAVQAVSKGYVDQSIAELTQSLLTASGGSLSGPLFLNGDPTQPTQAVTKRYVDNEFAQALPVSGGAASGPLTSVQLGAAFQADQFPGADFGAKLQACLNKLDPVYGGTCDARNFTGTQSSGSAIVVSTANATVQLPCATIATANPIRITAGTRNVTMRGCALRGASNASGSQGGTVFLYSGTGPLIQVGDPTYVVDTLGFHLDNVVINTTATSDGTAQGLAAYRTQEVDLEGLYLLGNPNQTGITLDGTGNYTGGTFQDIQLGGFAIALNAIGHQVSNSAPTDWLNASTFVRLHINCPTNAGSPMNGTYGINLLQGDGNTFTGGDVEGCGTALHLGPNAQNNTIIGLRNENSINQVVADAGSSYNNWMTGGTMFTGQLTDNGTRNSFLDTFHRSFNGLNGDWYGSQKDATVTNHFRIGTGTGTERGLLNRYQTDYGYRWTTGLSDASAGAQFYQVLDELNSVYRLSIGQYNHGESSTNNQTVINAAGTGAVVLNGSTNAGTGGVIFGAGGSTGAAVATINSAGNAQFNGSLQVGGPSTFSSSTTVRNQADAEIDHVLWAGSTANQKESYIYKDYTGASQWYMVKDASNNWALNSAIGGLDSFKAYQSSNSGDTYVNATNSTGHIRLNYEAGSGAETDIYSGPNSTLVAAFLGNTAIKFPGLAATSGRNCLQIDNSGYISNTGSACGGGISGTVNAGNAGQVAFYTGNGTAIAGTTSVAVAAGGTGATTAAQARQNLGAQPAMTGVVSDGASGIAVTGNVSAAATVSGSVNGVYDLKAAFGASGSNQTMTCTATSGNSTLTGCTGGDFKVGQWIVIPQAGISPTVSAPTGLTLTCGNDHIPTWASTATYAQDQTVVSSGVYYISLQAANLNNPPASSPTFWSSNGTPCPPSPTSTVTYTYQVVEVQGVPNGALSAPSSPVSITMSKPIQQAPDTGSQPDIFAQLNWTGDATNSTGYEVYRGVNGGPLNYYYHVSYHIYNLSDYNTWQPAQATCVDMGVPCTVPSGATPNDVYAQITAISGSSVTIAANTNPYQSVYWGVGFTGAYPSQPSVSGTVTVQHDDTPAFELMRISLSALPAHGQIKVHVPAGQYNLHCEGQYAGYCAAIRWAGLNNVTLEGDGDASYLYQTNDRGGTFSRGMYSTCADPHATACTAWRMGAVGGGTLPTKYSIVDPAPFGSTSVTLSTPSDASNFPAGAYVTVYNDNTGYAQEYYGEINLVASSDSSTGIVRLAYPLTKQYSASITVAPFSQCTICAGVPKMSLIPGGIEASNITIRNLKIRSQSYSLFAFNAINDQITIENNSINASSLSGFGTSRHIVFRNNTVIEDGYTVPSGMLQLAASTQDVDIVNNHYTGLRSTGTNQFCTEGTANLNFTGNTVSQTGATSVLGNSGLGAQPNHFTVFNFLAMCFNANVTGNTISLANTAQRSLFWWDGSVGGVTVANNDIYVDSVSSSIPASLTRLSSVGSVSPNPQMHLYNNRIRIGNKDTTFAGGNGPTTAFGPAWAPFNIVTVSAIGDWNYSSYAGQYTMTVVNMTGNLTSITLGNSANSLSRLAGLYYALDFVQPASGGPYTLPSDCTDAKWRTGNGIDCPNGPPVAQTAANSHTILWFYDDGTLVHLVSQNTVPSNVCLSNGTNCPPGSGGGANVPQWLNYTGEGSEGALTCTTGTTGYEHWYSSFTVNAGQTCKIGARGQVIRVTGACTINGTLDASAIGAGTVSVLAGGGTGGGGGGGTAAGVAGSGTNYGSIGTSGGSAGASSGGNGGNGAMFVSTQAIQSLVSAGITADYAWGGGTGGNGANSGGAGGSGGEYLVLICGSLTGTGTIRADGGYGQPSVANNTGAGGGGGGGVIVTRSPADTSALTLITNGGPGGSNVVPQAQWYGGGNTGLTTSTTVSGGAVTAINVGGTTTGWLAAPNCVIVGGGGTGATCHFTTSGSSPALTITGAVVDAGGSGYTASAFTTSGTGGNGGPGWSKQFTH